jgi:hypothetical protein
VPKAKKFIFAFLTFFLVFNVANTTIFAQMINKPETCSDSTGARGIDTAIGCIPIENSSGLLGFILRWAIGIGGGIAFILIIISGFMIMTASGNPEKLQAGKELMTSAIMGLIMLIFSVFLLKIIGVDILGLSGIT